MNQQVESFCEKLRRIYPTATVRLDPLPSGVYFLEVTLHGKFFMIEYSPRWGYGIGEVKDEDGGFNSGHPYSSDTWEGATQRLLGVLDECVAAHTPAGQAKSA